MRAEGQTCRVSFFLVFNPKDKPSIFPVNFAVFFFPSDQTQPGNRAPSENTPFPKRFVSRCVYTRFTVVFLLPLCPKVTFSGFPPRLIGPGWSIITDEAPSPTLSLLTPHRFLWIREKGYPSCGHSPLDKHTGCSAFFPEEIHPVMMSRALFLFCYNELTGDASRVFFFFFFLRYRSSGNLFSFFLMFPRVYLNGPPAAFFFGFDEFLLFAVRF